jgi:hypothetical protein
MAVDNRLWWATLTRTSPRYEQWRKILGGDDVPLLTPFDHIATLGQDTEAVYDLDIGKLDTMQKARLADFIQGRFGAPRKEIETELEKVGFPIRASDCSVTFSMRAFL